MYQLYNHEIAPLPLRHSLTKFTWLASSRESGIARTLYGDSRPDFAGNRFSRVDHTLKKESRGRSGPLTHVGWRFLEEL